MSLEFFDGCGEYYNTAQMGGVWDAINGAAAISAVGRHSGNAIRLNAAAVTVMKSLSRTTTKVVGFAYQTNTFPASDTTFMELLGDENIQGILQISSTGQIVYKTGATEHLRSAVVLTAGAYNYIECKVVVDNASSGSVEIRLDGGSLMIATGIDTRNGGSTDIIAGIRMRGAGSRTFDFDDVYVDDTNFRGNCRADKILPDGDGLSSQWDTLFPTSPTTHFTKVDESPHTDDTDYIQTATTNDIDLFTFAAVPVVAGVAEVVAVKAVVALSKQNAGEGNFRLLSRPTSTTINGTTRGATIETMHHAQYYENNPQTSSPWTIAEINASQFGTEKL